MSNLYRVTIEVEMICYADSAGDAEDIARANFRKADAEMDRAFVNALAVSSVAKEERQWLPWGGDGVRTCAEILDGMRSESR